MPFGLLDPDLWHPRLRRVGRRMHLLSGGGLRRARVVLWLDDHVAGGVRGVGFCGVGVYFCVYVMNKIHWQIQRSSTMRGASGSILNISACSVSATRSFTPAILSVV